MIGEEVEKQDGYTRGLLTAISDHARLMAGCVELM